MKKAGYIAAVSAAAPIFLLVLSISAFGGQTTAPVTVFANDMEAYAYQYIGSELGVPWDIVLLVDGMDAYETDEKNLDNYNPMMTSLEFCVLVETEYESVLVYPDTVVPNEDEVIEDEKEESVKEPSPKPSQKPLLKPAFEPVLLPSEYQNVTSAPNNKPNISNAKPQPSPNSPEEETEWNENEDEVSPTSPEVVWEVKSVNYYQGAREILEYIGIDNESAKLNYKDVTAVITGVNLVAENKNTEQLNYEVLLQVNPDYETVLREKIGFSDEAIQYVMELYESNYLAALYGYYFETEEIILPEIVQGNVSRADLANVAVSLINHPYLLGGKSAAAGAPTGPLDAAGYIDWVYIQCFGVGVGNGSVPEGVAASGTAAMWYATEPIRASELKVGDLGFYMNPATIRPGQVNHAGIYLGTYENKQYWIHCGGSVYGTDFAPNGRVGISTPSSSNSYNPVTGADFSPEMLGCRFRYFRRPQFTFTDD